MNSATPLQDTLDDLSGYDWIPGVTQIVDGIRSAQHAVAAGQLSLDATQTLLSLLGNPNGPDLLTALAHLVQHVTSPANPSLGALPDDVRKTVQHCGEAHAYETAEYAPRDQPNEAAGLIFEHTPTAGRGCSTVTETDRKELSDKVSKANKQSANRPK
ncbi:hypothetical protein [Streptomyces sp. NPDC008150]|uniref:hypothetical protein n=1 Tax=Streptomyces sp. NPDC008150 TaxID=3364816 RepID=UPI0036E712FB